MGVNQSRLVFTAFNDGTLRGSCEVAQTAAGQILGGEDETEEINIYFGKD